MRRPGIRNERGTQVGASRRMPSADSIASRTALAVGLRDLVFFAGEVLVAIRGQLRRAGQAAGAGGEAVAARHEAYLMPRRAALASGKRGGLRRTEQNRRE